MAQGALSFQKLEDDLQRAWAQLLSVRDRMKDIPTCKTLAADLTDVAAKVETISIKLANTDHNGNT